MKTSKFLKMLTLVVLVLAMVATAACGAKEAPAAADTAKPGESSAAAPADAAAPAESATEPEWVFDRPVEWVCAFGAGSGNDQVMRVLAPEVSKILNVPINVTNVSGGSGAVGFEYFMDLPADGYSFLNCSPSHIIRSLAGDISGSIIDPEQFTPICIMSSGAYCVQGKSGQYADINALVEYAKANPGKLRIGGIGNLGVDYIAASQFMEGFGVDMVYVAFDSDTEITTALLTGDIDLGVSSPSDTAEYVEAGTTTCYVVFGSERNPVLPEVPCTAELNVDADFITARYLMARADTPAAAIKAMQDACVEAAKSESFVKYLELNGIFTEDEGFHDAAYLADYLAEMTVFMKEIGF